MLRPALVAGLALAMTIVLNGCGQYVDSGYPDGARVVREVGRPVEARFRNTCAAFNYETSIDGVSAVWCDPGARREQPVRSGGAPPVWEDSSLNEDWSRARPGSATIRSLSLDAHLFTQLEGGSFTSISQFSDAGRKDRAELLRPSRIFYSAAWMGFDLKCRGEWAWVRLWPLESARPGVYEVQRAKDGVWTMRRAASGEVVAQNTERCGMPPESPRNPGGPR